jgi:restriction endonuclease Mrr
LRELGGSATTTELKDKLVDKLNISEEELEEKLKSGVYRIDNQISWSKVYLSRSRLVEVSDSGVWSLTEKGFKEEPDDDDVLSIFKEIHGSLIAKRGSRKTDAAIRNEEVLHPRIINGQEEAEKETLKLNRNLTGNNRSWDLFWRCLQRHLNVSASVCSVKAASLR